MTTASFTCVCVCVCVCMCSVVLVSFPILLYHCANHEYPRCNSWLGSPSSRLRGELTLSVIHSNVNRQQHLTVPTWKSYKKTTSVWLYNILNLPTCINSPDSKCIFGPNIALVGMSQSTLAPQPTQSLDLHLVWEAERSIEPFVYSIS